MMILMVSIAFTWYDDSYGKYRSDTDFCPRSDTDFCASLFTITPTDSVLLRL